MKNHRSLLVGLLIVSMHTGFAQLGGGQTGDRDWTPEVGTPAYAQGEGPVVIIDAAHGNFHTMDGRFAAFARLLQIDGYRVASTDNEVTPGLLGAADVFVISNANRDGEDDDWILPTPPAFTDREIDLIVEWVEQGGSLLLIADHMPFPGATANLAERFGVVFYDCFALETASGGGTRAFTRADGTLADHTITRGRSDAESVDSVRAFTGQAFRAVSAFEPLLLMPDDWIVLLPVEAWEFSASTPRVSARGLVQGGVVRHGEGRVAIFGEAAMFTAQTSVRDGRTSRMGMNHPQAGQNAQFVLNVLHWMSGLLDDDHDR